MYSISLDQIINQLKAGKVVALPSDTIAGLFCLAKSSAAVRRLYKLKKRPTNMPALVIFTDLFILKQHIIWNPIIEKLSKVFWPNNLTIIAHKSPNSYISNLIIRDNKIAVRYTNHAILAYIIKYTGPLISTSLNIHSQKEIPNFNIPIFGNIFNGKASTIYDSINNNIIREGVFSEKMIKQLQI